MLAMAQALQIGARIYLRNCVAGEPGCLVAFDKQGRALVDWSADMPEINRLTAHDLNTLIVDEAFCVRQLDLFDEIAA
jgi:hypothetical protein